MGFKSKMLSDFLLPAVNGGDSSLRTIGYIVNTDEKNNTCVVKYRDKKNRLITKHNVMVRVSSYAVIDWFPEKGDRIIIELNGGVPVVVGEMESYSKTGNRSKSTLESDVYSDNMSCNNEGGYVF